MHAYLLNAKGVHKTMSAIRYAALLIAAIVTLCIPGVAEIGQTKLISEKLLPTKIGDERLYEVEDLSRFYEKRSEGVNWKLAQAEEMLNAIEATKTRGLDPFNYHWKAIQILNTNSISTNAISIEQDLLLSDAFLHLAHDLANGKVKPPAHWKLKRPSINTVDLLDQALDSNNISTILFSVEPQSLQYQIMVETIQNYRQIALNGGWKELSDGPRLSRGSSGDAVAAIRRRMKSSGEFFDKGEDEMVFDDLLDQAVRHFQQTHGLKVDGIIGPATLEQLNVPVEKRIRQLEVNLERMRWITDDLGERHIQINIPAFELTAFVQNNEWLTMHVIVGKSDWRTPDFLSSEITYLETNPYWYVPAEIANKEIWPKVAKNKNYLKKNRLHVVKRADGSLMLRQTPGTGNSLGQIKIHFANDFGCYLHDTPEKRLFDKSDRALSHGCIRLENAVELAEYLLIGDPEWDREKLENAIENDLQKKIILSEPVPISIVYFTAWVDVSNTVQFRKDIYGRDSILDQEMKRN